MEFRQDLLLIGNLIEDMKIDPRLLSNMTANLKANPRQFSRRSTGNQQEINRAITELDFFWGINTANGDMGYVDYDYYILLPSKIEYQQLLI